MKKTTPSLSLICMVSLMFSQGISVAQMTAQEVDAQKRKAEKKQQEKAPPALSIYVVCADEITGAPLKGAEVELTFQSSEQSSPVILKTDEKGWAVFSSRDGKLFRKMTEAEEKASYVDIPREEVSRLEPFIGETSVNVQLDGYQPVKHHRKSWTLKHLIGSDMKRSGLYGSVWQTVYIEMARSHSDKVPSS